MKYQKEIDSILKELFYEDWMTDNMYEETIDMILSESNSSKQIMNDQIEIGVKNGYDVQTQLNIFRQLFLTTKN
jgi:hypothetical protein